MRIHWFQHVPFEDLGCIAPYLLAHGHTLSVTRSYAGETPPALADIDALIVMGGPMNVDEVDVHPWLSGEKAAIAAAIAQGKPVLGICLGAQLIAASLGAAVTRNAETEIGWFEVMLMPQAHDSAMLADFPERFSAFHWHGDTFAIPDGAQHLMRSEACAHQAFSLGDQVIGLQFHLEVTAADARRMFWIERPAPGRYVQDPDVAMADIDRFAAGNRLMHRLLARWLAAAAAG
ncbi:type 1 glutamine amidotransferase [Sinimarinibacterium sp. CAU 1509]|uniref:type 1 glutamine amidotransferase n=1 Tax=Sinimarinibacterium sp. CAU 1509 TaxID=2562283 RepID=UPI0010ACBE71|nr:type 1 glutamine amidotransferase [Sinimarinibacterium sp. CAU 1509]TJY58186.1 type 1 glutamine amidotransferase [Sinimarinibacterium sp. CAU 1509]